MTPRAIHPARPQAGNLRTCTELERPERSLTSDHPPRLRPSLQILYYGERKCPRALASSSRDPLGSYVQLRGPDTSARLFHCSHAVGMRSFCRFTCSSRVICKLMLPILGERGSDSTLLHNIEPWHPDMSHERIRLESCRTLKPLQAPSREVLLSCLYRRSAIASTEIATRSTSLAEK